MKIVLGLAAIAAVTVPGVAVAVSDSDPATPAPAADSVPWLIPQSVKGVGRFTLHGPNVGGDQITFDIDGRMARTGITHGTFRFQHHKPGVFTSYGDGEITCLRVTGRTAILTAVIANETVPGRPEGIGVHAFFVRITDARSDRIQFTQAPPPPATPGCTDPLHLPPAYVDTSTLDAGNWTLHGIPG